MVAARFDRNESNSSICRRNQSVGSRRCVAIERNVALGPEPHRPVQIPKYSAGFPTEKNGHLITSNLAAGHYLLTGSI